MKALVLLGVAALTFSSSSDAAEPSPSADARRPAAEATARSKAPESFRTVMLDPSEPRIVCRRHAPTGSRIAEQRCESTNARKKPADEASRALLRRDIQALRDQQMMREQARQAVTAEGIRRRGGQ
jgi:hypothetical protein